MIHKLILICLILFSSYKVFANYSESTFYSEASMQFDSYCPGAPVEERRLLPPAIYIGVNRDKHLAEVFFNISILESGLKVRKWFPKVKQNMDTAGSHNAVLCSELYYEGLITDIKKPASWKKSKQWLLWRKFFQQRPDIGTMFAARWFHRLVCWHGERWAIQAWKCKPETVNGLIRKMQVTCLTTAMCRQ